MKKQPFVIGIISSAHEGSNSAVMVREALKGATEKGATVLEVFLPDYHLDFCTGCLTCMKTGQCRLPDQFNVLREKLHATDGIIWGSPTYAGAPNAIMKNLIDRLGMYEVTTSSFGGKYMLGIASANSAGAARKVAKGLSRFGIGGTFLRSYSTGYLGASFRGGRKAAQDAALLAQARRNGGKLVDDIRSARKYPLQGLPQRMLSALLLKPAFSNYIKKHKGGESKVLYDSLRRRNLLA